MKAHITPYKSAALAAWLLGAVPVSAQDLPPISWPDLPRSASRPENFVPPGWRIERRETGDLDADGSPDLALVLRSTDPAAILAGDEYGSRPLDTRPRIIAVALATPGGGYRLLHQDHALVPRSESTVQEDPLSPEDAEFRIANGSLRISLYRFSSAGGWDMGLTRFNFRLRDGALRLVGFDFDNVHRATGCLTSLSINYLTRRAKLTVGNVGNDEDRVEWRRLPNLYAPTLDEVGDGLLFDPEELVSRFPLACADEE